MSKVSEKTLYMIDDLVRALGFELKTGQSVKISIGPNTFDMENFARKRSIFVNDQNVGDVIDHIDPFV